MNIDLGALKFANLLEIARLSSLDGYRRQEELVAIFREKNQPFLAVMPYRHRCRCDVCGVDRGESLFHFENPEIPCEGEKNEAMWGKPKGLWCEIETSELHAILAHGKEPNIQFKEVIESVGC